MSRKKKIYQIKVSTVQNGYVLQFEGAKQPDGYMYFSPEALVEGMFAHIALKHDNELTRDRIRDIMTTATEWQGIEKALHDIKSLQTKLDTSRRNHCNVAEMLVAERKRYMALRHEMVTLKKAAAQGDDQMMKELSEAIMSRHIFYPEILLNSLGVDSDVLLKDEPEQQEDEEDDDTKEPTT